MRTCSLLSVVLVRYCVHAMRIVDNNGSMFTVRDME